MQIVIDIPETHYDYIRRYQSMSYFGTEVVTQAIINGTILPKGYGNCQPSSKGHWIDREEYDADRWKCSECGRTEQYQENFCPNCGAEMESEDADSN